jgi:hypothetical protein
MLQTCTKDMAFQQRSPPSTTPDLEPILPYRIAQPIDLVLNHQLGSFMEKVYLDSHMVWFLRPG